MDPITETDRPTPRPETTARHHQPPPRLTWPPPRVFGTVVTMKGCDWLLDESIPPGAEVWDRLYDQNIIRRKYEPEDVMEAAAILLLRNYELSASEVIDLISSADVGDLVPAVEMALFGADPTQTYRTWGDWVSASFWANGIDPATIPPAAIRDTLDILVETRRTVPAADFISSQTAMAARKKLLNFGKE